MSNRTQKREKIGIAFEWLRNKFLAGVFVAMPVALTVWIVNALYQLIKGPFDSIIRMWIRQHILPGSEYFIRHHGGTIPGAGFIMTIVMLVLLGVVAGNYIGRKFMVVVDQIFLRLPIIKTIYLAFKQAVDAIRSLRSSTGEMKFSQVVTFAAMGGELIGFVTNRYTRSDGAVYCNVFLPTSPSPLTGFILIVPEKDLRLSELTVEDASKMIISFGLIMPTLTTPKEEVPVPKPIDTRQTH